MKPVKALYALLLGTALSGNSYALDQTDEDALKDTQALLHSQQRMEDFAKTNPDAQKALGDVHRLTNGDPAAKAEINSISSAVFEDMVRSNNGDSAALQLKLQQALKDPKAFMQTLSPEQQARIRALASEIDAKNAKK